MIDHPWLANLRGVGSHPRMRPALLALAALSGLLLALAGCSPPLPPDVAPPRASRTKGLDCSGWTSGAGTPLVYGARGVDA